MADRTVTARLRLQYQDFVKGAQASGKSLKGLGDEAARTAKRTSDDWQRLGKSTSDLGSSMTTKLTLPIVAAGGLMAKMAMDFGSQFDQMVALAGVASSEVDGLKESVLGISEATGRGPQELAEALMQIRGAGLTGQAALDALEVSAKAAASGLGSTTDVANALTNVMNGYGAANISAAEAGDILTAAVTSAKVEASEMAPQFGRLIPVAAELGVGFDDVAGALAFLTVSSGDAAQASTGLSGVLTKLLNPSQQGREALRNIGIEASDLRTMLGQQGLDGTIIELRKRLGDAGFRQLLDDSEALKAGLQMTGASAEQFSEIMGDVEDSTGALDEAFKATDNDTRKAQIAWAKAQGALIRFGEAIVPIVTILADLAAAAAGVLGGMPDSLRTAIVMFGALLAAAGPVLHVTGKLAEGLGAYSKWLETSSFGTGRFGDQLSKLPAIARGAALALGAIGVAMAAIEVINGQRESRVRGWVEDQIGDPGTLNEVRASIRAVKDELAELEPEEGKGQLFEVAGVDIYATNGDADRQERIDQLRERMGELEAQEESLVGQEAETAAAFVGTSDAAAGLSEETSNAVTELQALADALTAQFDPLFGMTDALVGNQEAQRAVTEAQAALNQAIAEHGPNSEEAAQAQRDLDAAYSDATRSALDYEVAATQLQAGIEAGTVSLSDAKAQLARWVEQGLISQQTATEMGRKFDIAALKAAALDGSDPNVNVTTSGIGTADARIQYFLERLGAIPDQITTVVNVVTRNLPGGSFLGVGNHAAGGPMRPGEVSWVGEQGPELLVMGNQAGHIYNQAQLASMSSPMASAAAYGAGSVTNITVDMGRGIFVGNQRDFRQAVQKAFNEANRKGRGVNA